MAIRSDQRTATPEALIGELTGAQEPRRRYREEEVQRIIGRAAEMEATNPTASGAMTVGGVEALAAEVGIKPESVREAAQALAVPGPSAPAPLAEGNRPNGWIGGPTRLMFERIVEGEVPEDEFPVMVDEIRRTLSHPGQATQLGRSFSWASARTGGSTRAVEVSVSVHAGRTRITVQENLGALIGGVFGGVCGGLGGGGLGPVLGVLGSQLGAAAAFIAAPLWLAVVFSVARSGYFYTTRRRLRELEMLADRLEAVARSLVPPLALGGPRRQLPR
jgi:hypothetical protein